MWRRYPIVINSMDAESEHKTTTEESWYVKVSSRVWKTIEFGNNRQHNHMKFETDYAQIVSQTQ